MIPAALVVLLFGLGASLALTPILAHLATRRGWLDQPDGRRKMHSVPVPRLGGVSVYASFLLAFGALVTLAPEAASDGPGVVNTYVHLVVACGAVMLIGLADDLVGVSPLSKVAVQSAAGLFLFFHGYQINSITNPFGGAISLGLLSLPLTVLWFVGMSNALNLIDGLDGLAAGVALFATVSLFAAAALNQHWETAFLAAALGGALLGFLRYNFSPASIFLGDSGSLFVGFALAAFAIRGSMKTPAAIALAGPLLALALPIFDVAVAILRRTLGGTLLFRADREHVHHRLVRQGLTPRRAVIILYGVAALLTCLSLVVMTGPRQVLWAVASVLLLLTWVGVRQLGYAEFGELQRILLRALVPDRRTVANNVFLLGVREDLARAKTFAETWDILVDAASRLRCESVEILLYPAPEERLCEALAPGRPRNSFPSWASGSGVAHRWSWTILLGEPDRGLGELVLGFDPAKGALTFEPTHLLDAVTQDFAAAAGRFLHAPEEGTAVRPGAGQVAGDVASGAQARVRG